MLESGEALVARVSSGPSATGGEGSAAPQGDWGGEGVACREQVEEGQRGRWPSSEAGTSREPALRWDRRDLGAVCCQVVMCLLSLASHKVFSNSEFLYVVM